MKDNKGFSFIELMITIAILGVLIGVMVVRIDSLMGYSAREACSKIDKSLSSLQVSCLSKSKGNANTIKDGASLNPQLDIYIEIYKNQKGITFVKFHEEGKDDIVKELAPRRVTISYTFTDDAGAVEVGEEGQGLFLSYNRATGAFIPQTIVGSDKTEVKKIYCKSGKKNYQLKLMPNTGKVLWD